MKATVLHLRRYDSSALRKLLLQATSYQQPPRKSTSICASRAGLAIRALCNRAGLPQRNRLFERQYANSTYGAMRLKRAGNGGFLSCSSSSLFPFAAL